MHHERFDGTGYPMGIFGDKIDKYARIVAIADVYDAMTACRVYRGPLCPFRVIEIFEAEGYERYDVHFLLTFLENVVNTYIQNHCRLSDGREGDIIFINKKKLSRPVVQCGKQYVDLAEETDLSIVELL
jgi:HD-GYP domain-containing protein (c-di-GMP phosphodiesterase class II)